MKKMIQILIIFLTFSALAATFAVAAPGGSNKTIIADFSAAPTSGNAPLTVQFKDNSSGNLTLWFWDFGDGTSATYTKKVNTTHIYLSSGIYTATLTVSNQNRSSQKAVTVNVTEEKPVAAFSASTTTGKAPLIVNFIDKSTGSPTSWFWDFGDGTYSIMQNPTHNYYAVGTYTVNLTVTNSGGSNLSSSKINVTSAPGVVANFSSNVTSGNAPLTVQFNDLSTGNPTTWNWNFGDGTTSNEQNPTHSYLTANTYTVILITGNYNSWSTATNYITVLNELLASFTASPLQGEVPLTVQFTDISMGSPTAWIWDFGDGNNTTEQNPAHIYTKAGNYTVKLTASNSVDSNTSIIPSFINASSSNTLVANFSSNVTSGSAPLTVQFNDLSTGSPATWEWDFGDGSNSTLQNSSHIYTEAGNYTVKLTASNSVDSNTSIIPSFINVSSSNTLVANFSSNVTSGNAPLTVQFNDLSTGSPATWEWDFGDGNRSNETNPTHTYFEPGSYAITLNVSNNKNEHIGLTFPGYITVTSESDSSSGGGSSSTRTGSLAGMGVSPEPTSNIAVKIMTQKFVTGGTHIRYEFTKNSTCIDFIEFDAKKTLGKTTATVEQLNGRSVLTPEDPMGNVYKYVNIWVGNSGIAIPENIGNATIGFEVNKTEIELNLTEAIILQRYVQGEWNPLITNKTGEDDQYIYYQASTPGFSSFAITSDEINQTEENVSQLYEDNLTQPKVPYNNELSIQSKQPGKPESVNNTNWSKFSGVIEVLILFMVLLFIGLAIKEKRR